jgi:small subunit ribosomal protein S20
MRRIVTEWCRGAPLTGVCRTAPATALFPVNLHDPVAKALPGQYHSALFRSPRFKEDLMANIASAKKRARQAENRRAHNVGQRTELRSAIKNVKKAIAAGDKKAAQAQFQVSQSRIDSIADKRIVHKNTVSRQKSRLAAAIKAMS